MQLRSDPRERRFEIEGRTVGYPTHFRDGSSAMGLFLVPTAAADRLIRDSGFRAAEIAPGKAVLSLVCVHYTDTDCGPYEEIALAVMARRYGQPRKRSYLATIRDLLTAKIPSFTYRLGVTTLLSREAGIRMWGYPKTVENIDYERAAGRATFTWQAGDTYALRFSVPDRGTRTPSPISPPVYSIHEGMPKVSYLDQTYRDVCYHVRGGSLEIGTHAVADELRSLGLPKRPLLSVWNTHLAFEMSAPQPLR